MENSQDGLLRAVRPALIPEDVLATFLALVEASGIFVVAPISWRTALSVRTGTQLRVVCTADGIFLLAWSSESGVVNLHAPLRLVVCYAVPVRMQVNQE